MARTRSKRARDEKEGVAEDDDATRHEQAVHSLVQLSIQTHGLHQTLTDLDDSALTRPLAATLRAAIESREHRCALGACESEDGLCTALRRAEAHIQHLEAQLDRALNEAQAILADWKLSMAERRAAEATHAACRSRVNRV